MEILQKGTVSAEFRANCLKLCANCVFPQNFHTRKLGETAVFYAKKIEKSEHTKVEHSKKPGREKTLHFKEAINITATNYSFTTGSCFKLLLRTQLMSCVIHLSKQCFLWAKMVIIRYYIGFFIFTVPISMFLIACKYI